MRTYRQQPTRLPRPWDSPGKSTRVGCHFLLQCMKVKSESEVAQSCPTLSNPMDCSPPGSSAHGVFQARALQWAPVPSPSLMLTTAKSPWQTMLPWANHLTSEPPFSHLWNGTKTSTSLTEYETRWKLKALEVPRSPWKKSTATGQQQLWETAFQPSHLIHFKS